MSSSEPSSEIALVHKVAALARLDIHGAEEQALAAQFARILEQFRVLSETDVEGVEPMTGASGLSNVERADVPEPSFERDAMLANAPARLEGFYSVPKTIGGDE